MKNMEIREGQKCRWAHLDPHLGKGIAEKVTVVEKTGIACRVSCGRIDDERGLPSPTEYDYGVMVRTPDRELHRVKSGELSSVESA